MKTTFQLFQILLQASYDDEPLEASVKLPFIPIKGDNIEVWVAYRDDEGYVRPGRQGEECFLTVLERHGTSYAPERIVCQVSTEGYREEQVSDIFRAIKENDQP